ncbi:modification methylase [uncultured Candidatus Thioglobus sp.]|nr:modification methylase [uncultured Candidatus Thioglobus sp.]
MTTTTSKNKYGQYWTPELIANFMIGLADIQQDSKILEPSSGTGVFLNLLQQKKFNKISAYEIDEELAKKYEYIKNESFISANIQDKYNLVIGNPPYIRWKNLECELKSELANNYLWKKYFNSLCDYSYLFILKSIELLAEGGQLIFITPEYWLNTMHSISLRNYMVEHGYFSEIYHFNETPIFNKATVSTIVFKYVKNPNVKNKKINIVKYYANKKLTNKIINNIKNKISDEKTDVFKISQFQQNKRWLLADEKKIKEFKLFEDKCIHRTRNTGQQALFPLVECDTHYCKISEICEIGNGMVSGLDKAFQLNGEHLNANEKNSRLQVIKAKDLKPFTYKNTTKYIFANEVESDVILEKDYPNYWQKLQDFKPKLNKRYQYNKKINYWQWVFMRNFNLFNTKTPRIFVPSKERISNKDYFRFSYVEQNIFPTQDVTAIFKKDNIEESLYYILALLNNHRTFNWLKYNGVVKGNIVEFSEKPIASIPFRKIDWQDKKEIQIHNIITGLCKNYIEHGSEPILKKINTEIDKLFQ